MELGRDNQQSDEQRGPEPVGPAGAARVCLVSLGGESFAIDLSHVREVFKLESITPVPGMPPSLVGVANLRGTVIPIADLRPSLGVSGPATPKYAVVVQQGAQQVGIMIDEVPEIRTIHSDALLAEAAQEIGARRPFLSGLLNIEDRLSGMVEVSRVLASVESATVHQSGSQ